MRYCVSAGCMSFEIVQRKQKEGKRRMKRVGRVEIPQEAFLAVLKVGGGSSEED